jgi:hypothetical protein
VSRFGSCYRRRLADWFLGRFGFLTLRGKPPPDANIIHNTNDLTEAVPLGKRRLPANTTLSLRIGWKEPW